MARRKIDPNRSVGQRIMRLRMGRKPRPEMPCIVPGCGKLIQRRQYCIVHYRALVLPRCRIRGCGRTALQFGLCHPHWKNGGRPIRVPRRNRSRTGEPRILAWGRVHVVPSVVPLIEAEARRRLIAPSAMIAEIVESWARSKEGGYPLLRVPEKCRGPECARVAGIAGLCRTHRLQAIRGQPLLPIRPKQQEVRMGSLRLPAAPARRLKRDAKRQGLTFAEALRRAVDLALRQPDKLAEEGSGPGNATIRLGALPMPAELAERLNTTAQRLGVPVSAVVRRALENRISS